MEAVLYICHGSRVKQAQEQAVSFIQSCMEEINFPIQEYCFLELATPSIETAFRKCISRGATKIIAIPVLLLTAGHAKEDIPNELSRLNSIFPGIKIEYSQPIGVHPDIIEILVERIKETKHDLTTEESMILLVGRGSGDPQVKLDLSRIAEMLSERSGIKKVEICFLAASNPSFEEGFQLAKESGFNKVFIIPYLLFTGILMKKVKKMIKAEPNPNQQMLLCSNLGYHPLLVNIIKDRVREHI